MGAPEAGLGAYHRRSRVAAPAEAVEAWQGRPGAAQRLATPWGPRWPLGPDGPVIRDWVHLRRCEPLGPDVSVLEDHAEYGLPAGRAADLAERLVQADIDRTLRYQHRRIVDDVERHHGVRPLRIAVSGAGGLVGSHLVPFLTAGGHEVHRLGRDPEPMDGLDAVVHLAGEPFHGGPWTAARRARLLSSRVDGTRRLCEKLAALDQPPGVLITASTTGIYGHRDDEVLDELAPTGSGFLASLARAWEAAAYPASGAGIRVVHLRLGVVLSARGGLLPALAAPFRWFMGGPWGRAEAWTPWVALEDVLGAVLHAAASADLAGPVNVVSPNPLRLTTLSLRLGEVLRRPSWLPMPPAVLEALLGDLAHALLLDSRHVVPRRLLETGFGFRCADIEDTLRHELGRFPAAAEPLRIDRTA